MPKPLVTGISPKEGYPGTKVIIRGEFLGKDESDLVSVKICGVDCTLRSKWEKESRITTYTGFCIGKGDIIITTHSGGVGTSSVGFQGLVKKNIGLNEESCVWIEEDARSILTGLKRQAVADILHDNPLKISVDESSKLSRDFFDKEFPNSSIDMTKENFNPMRFLLENYQNAKFEDLKSGLNYMKSNIGSKSSSSTENLLKTNISSFMDAIKIMKDIHTLSTRDKKQSFALNLENLLKEILKESHKIYDHDLESKDNADLIRNFLQITETYKAILYFSQNVDKYLKNEDYEQIINGYKLINNQFAKMEPNMRKTRFFAQCKDDIDKKLTQTLKCILEKLVQFPSSPDDQRYLIDYFNELKAFSKSDVMAEFGKISPAWYCLQEEKNWFIKLMVECRDMFIADEKVSLALKESSASEKVEEKGDQQQIAKNTQPVPHERNKFIEELCEMFFDIFTDYWRLGQIYLNNLLSKESAELKHTSDDFYALVAEILSTFTDIIRTAFIPHTCKENSTSEESDSEKRKKNLLLPWPIQHDTKMTSQILPHCLRVCRMCALQIFSLEIPQSLFETIQNLIYDLRCECLKVLLSTPTHEILGTLGFEEQDWILERDIDQENNSSLITSIPFKFEAKVTKALMLSKESVLDDKKGEKPLFKDSAFTSKIAMLLYGILHALLKRISRFLTKEDELPKGVNITRGKMLLYLYNSLTLCKNKILPNIWNMITQHKYKQIDQVIKESKKNVKELQDKLLKRYMVETIGPIVNAIENNLYSGKYDFTDSSPPTNVRNYIKIIIMSLITVHSELFLINKSLIFVVFTYAVKEIYSKLLSLYSNVPQIGKNAAIQTYIDLFCLRETFSEYTSDESKEIIQKLLKLIPSDSLEENKRLISKIFTEFKKVMQPYIVVFQQTPPSSSILVSFSSKPSKKEETSS